MLAQGTLVRVRTSALFADQMEKHDTLWIITKERIPPVMDGPGAYRCKSLATGEHWTWFTDEFGIEEQADDDTDRRD